MCGIIGYKGSENALPIVIHGLKNLEYRGYDSSGIAYFNNDKINIYKKEGKIVNLESILPKDNSTMAIGHTRWATHGIANTVNAHPHRQGKITLVHNGIIENYRELKEMLEENGYTFISDTDTEIIAGLIDYYYNIENNMVKALNHLRLMVRGSYALGILVDGDDKLYATRLKSPLIVGIGDDGLFGGNMKPILKVLSMKHVMDEGIVNAIKTTQNIRGIVKSTQAMLKPEDVKKMRDQFIEDFVTNNKSGIGGLDATTDFTPVKIEPTTASDSQVKIINNKLLSYFGVNENIVQSKYSEDEWNAFYESVLEPIGLQMSLEFSNKLFTPTEKNFGNEIIFESNKLQYASNKTKIEVIRYCSNIMWIDELREVMNLAPLPNGEGEKILIDQNHQQLETDEEEEEDNNEREGN